MVDAGMNLQQFQAHFNHYHVWFTMDVQVSGIKHDVVPRNIFDYDQDRNVQLRTN
jgi:hypothetical protein